MKKFLTLSILAVFTAFIVTSCNSSESSDETTTDSSTTDHTEVTEVVEASHSALYNDFMFKTGGDLLGVSLGDSEADVLAAWGEGGDVYEDGDYKNIEYYKGVDDDYTYGADFDSEGNVDYIYAQYWIEEAAASEELFNELKADFDAQFGAGELSDDEDGYKIYYYEKGDTYADLEFDSEYGVSAYIYY